MLALVFFVSRMSRLVACPGSGVGVVLFVGLLRALSLECCVVANLIVILFDEWDLLCVGLFCSWRFVLLLLWRQARTRAA